MGRYLGPKIKKIRQLGLLPGLTLKKIKNRVKTPGQHGINLHTLTKRLSISDDYKERLIEKQKLCFNYGIREKVLFSYYKKAQKACNSFKILELLETRLDSIIYRLGFANSISFARQLIRHGHILLNKKKVNIPSIICSIGDKIEINNNSLKFKTLILNNLFNNKKKLQLIQQKMNKSNNLLNISKNILPSFLIMNIKNLVGFFIGSVKKEDILLEIDELKIFEYYSK